MIQDDVVPALISEDGRWWWDGAKWRPRTVEGKLDLFWFTSTPDWVSRVLVTGLIGLIPIVGSINLLGWTLEAADKIRAGWKELPPAGFQYLSRGVAPFVVALVYGVLLFFVLGTMAVFVVVLATSGNSRLLVPAIALGFLIMLILLAWWLASLYLLAAVLLASDRLGIAKAIDPRRLFGLARANHEVSLHVALVYGAATIVIAGISVAIGVIIPFSSLLISIGLPAVYAMIVPSLATFRVEAPPSQLPPP